MEELFDRKLRKPVREDKVGFKGLELNVSLFDIDSKEKKKDNFVSEGSFLLNKGVEIIAAGSFYVKLEDGEKHLQITGIKGKTLEDRKAAIEALKSYAKTSGYFEFIY